MSACVVLAVELDSWMSPSEVWEWRSAGYYFIRAGSTREAVNLLREGDFDLVLLGESVQFEGARRLIEETRSMGSKIPVEWIKGCSSELRALAMATARNEPDRMLEGIRETLASRSGITAKAASMRARA